MSDEKIIYSFDEIKKSAENLNNETQNSKNWLMKSLELISAETVLKNIKKGDKVLEEISNKSPYIKKIKLIQEALGYYYFAYFRSKNKDKRALKGIEKQKNNYIKELELYIKENIELKIAYEDQNNGILAQSLEAFEATKHHDAVNLKKILIENRKAHECYYKFIKVEYSNISEARKDYKEYFSQTTKLIRTLNTEIRDKFKKDIEKVEDWIINEDKLIKVNKREIKTTLTFISYFNSTAYTKYTGIINKFFMANLINSFMENDIEYSDYDQLNKFSEKYIQLLKNEDTNEIVKNAIIRLENTMKKYNDSYAEHQFNLLFGQEIPNREFIDKIYMIEKLINNYSEASIISFLEKICDTIEKEELGDKIFELENYIKECKNLDISFIPKLKQLLEELHNSLQDSYEIKGEFKLEIEDLGNNHTYVLFKKKNINIGRSRLNDIRINSIYIATGKHVLIDTETNNIYNGSKENDDKNELDLVYNMSFINDNGHDKMIEANIYNDKIYELNLGHAFTYKFSEKNDNLFTLEPFEDKSNPACANEYSFEKFKNTKYVMIKSIEDIYLEKSGNKVSLTEEEGMFAVKFKDSKLFLEGVDEMPRIITEGENIINNQYRLTFQTFQTV